MQIPYNYYINKSDCYKSEIAFINIQNPIIKKPLYYIKSKNTDYLKTGFYVDNEKQHLQKFYNKYFHNYGLSNNHIEDDYIEDINISIRYYSYIKILKDENNPQLEGEKMIFYFGKNINDKIYNYNYILKNKKFKHTFQFNMYKKQQFPVYDNSFFTNNKIEIYEDLDLETLLNFKVYNRLKMDRRKKLENIFKK